MLLKKFPRFVVPAIGQGAGGNDICEDSHRIKILQYGIDMGMTLIDTAEVYQGGHSEEVVGQAIQGRRDVTFISTKFNPNHSRYQDVGKALEGSLRRLSSDYVDLYQVHWPNPAIPLEETMKALVDLKKSGKVLHLGVSNFSMQELLDAEDVTEGEIESVQVEYNVLERGIEEELLPYCERQRVMTLAYNPLLRSSKGAEVVFELGRKYGQSEMQIILNWLISRRTVIPIPKTLSQDHMRENALAASFALESEDIERLDECFERVVIRVSTDRIRVVPSDQEPVYVTFEEAMGNPLSLAPSPQELAKDLLSHQILKPVRLVTTTDRTGRYDYDLVQGRVRYWAWVIAYGRERPIPAYVND